MGDPEDLHIRLVRASLERRGCTVSTFNIAQFANEATLSFAPTNPVVVQVSDILGCRVLDSIDAVWYRRQGQPRICVEMIDSDREFSLREWGQTLDAMMQSLDAKFVNTLIAQRSAVKPRQLVVASRCGLRIPDTLVTSDQMAAANFIDRHRGGVIHKTMSAPGNQFAATQRWDEGERGEFASLLFAPVLFQEEIIGHSDVRAVVIGDHVMAARFESNPNHVDSRLSRDSPCEPWTLPAPVYNSLLDMMHSLGLVFGVVDLKITVDDDYVFLEVNPQGQFLYVEMLTGFPITDALADFLLAKEA
ncbi:MvdC/MvdD family ATP grasp protein [Streptomyces prunicolor]|uniref:MvdC/MvdD family ATP grasp protein n=1 Tax=Streptomyces prunicolor TaxID=67348 RepID=UPI00340FC88D